MCFSVSAVVSLIWAWTRLVVGLRSAFGGCFFFPSAPSIVEPNELRSYAHGSDVYLSRLPFTDGASSPYYILSSVTSLKLYSWDTLPTYWGNPGAL
ncbi:hypothetical protein CPB85DRAFT_413596 [Mucidula mucida]|nr:hypothetical protein CPB85DRAFT_413596 [Mucidula mucida]